MKPGVGRVSTDLFAGCGYRPYLTNRESSIFLPIRRLLTKRTGVRSSVANGIGEAREKLLLVK